MKSDTLKKIIVGTVILIVALLIFQIGEFVGYKKAAFSYQFGERYYKSTFGRFDSRRNSYMGRMMNDFSETNGAVGRIIKIQFPTLILEGRDGVEKIVSIEASTTIKQLRNDLKSNDLKVDQNIMVIGEPNDKSEIQAKFIRVLP